MHPVAHGVRAWLTRYGLFIVAAALTVAATTNALSYPSGSRVPAVVFSAYTAAAVLLRRIHRPGLTPAVALGLIALTAVGIGVTPMWAFVELLLVSFWTTEGLPARHARWSLGVLLVAGIAFDARSGENTLFGSVLSPLVIIGAPALAGALLRRSRDQAGQLRALSAQLLQQRDQAAAAAELAERARIAREIHDIVAHTVSVMLVQAGAAEQLVEPGHPASAAVGSIRTTGKQALAELRRVIGVLRSASSDDVHPQPTVGDLRELIVAARAGGATVHVDWRDDVDDLLPGVQLTVYRTIQEALTNVRKHAPHATATVRLQRDETSLRVTVDDDGAGRAAHDAPGYGLVGLRERADLYDGTLRAGPRPDTAGWRVELSIPTSRRRTREQAS